VSVFPIVLQHQVFAFPFPSFSTPLHSLSHFLISFLQPQFVLFLSLFLRWLPTPRSPPQLHLPPPPPPRPSENFKLTPTPILRIYGSRSGLYHLPYSRLETMPAVQPQEFAVRACLPLWWPISSLLFRMPISRTPFSEAETFCISF